MLMVLLTSAAKGESGVMNRLGRTIKVLRDPQNLIKLEIKYCFEKNFNVEAAYPAVDTVTSN